MRAIPANAVMTTPERRPSVLPTNDVSRDATGRVATWRRISGPSVVAALAGAWLLGACGGSSNGPPVPVDDLARLMADALCTNIGPCCKQSGFPHDPAQCHATAQTEYQRGIDQARPTANVGYDANAARACVDAFTAAVQACREPSESEIGTACRGVFFGTLQLGQTCTKSSECIAGATCQLTGAEMLCVGSRLVRGKLGDRCNATCTEVAGGTSCFGGGGGGGTGGTAGTSGTGGTAGTSGTGGTAGTSGGAGGAAGTSSPPSGSCYTNDGLYCNGMQTCAAQPTLNQLCTAGTPCAGEAFCDNAVCIAKRTTGSCGQFGDGCAATSYCDFANLECQPRKPTGAACTTMNDECLSADRCAADGTCRPRTIASASACMGNL